MKKSIKTLLVSLLLPICSLGLNVDNDKNYKPIFIDLLANEGIHTYWIPPFLAKAVLSIGHENQNYANLLDDCRSIRFAIIEKTNILSLKVCNKIVNELENNGYKSIVQIFDSKSVVSIMTLSSKSIIRELVILIRDENDIVALSLKGKIDPSKLSKTIISLNKSSH